MKINKTNVIKLIRDMIPALEKRDKKDFCLTGTFNKCGIKCFTFKVVHIEDEEKYAYFNINCVGTKEIYFLRVAYHVLNYDKLSYSRTDVSFEFDKEDNLIYSTNYITKFEV